VLWRLSRAFLNFFPPPAQRECVAHQKDVAPRGCWNRNHFSLKCREFFKRRRSRQTSFCARREEEAVKDINPAAGGVVVIECF